MVGRGSEPPWAAFLADAKPEVSFRVPPKLFPTVVNPRFVSATAACFMRPDDWVVGLLHQNVARCYPAFMLDNYHAVNDTIGDTPVAVMHCEICCSNAVYAAERQVGRLTFDTAGLYGATLAVHDEQTGSLWSHGMGVALEGPLRGEILTRLPSFQASFAEWVSLFPDTEVMVWPCPPSHPDPRHGHGTDATFAAAGMEPLVVRTLTAPHDDRLPEHEIVITIFTEGGCAALPFQELYAAGGLLLSEVGGRPLATISHRHGSVLAGTFENHLADDPACRVALELRDDQIVDRQTGSVFRADGLAVGGPLAGRRLQPVPTMINKWHSLYCFLPGIPILRHQGPRASIPEAPLASVLAHLREHGWTVTTSRRLYDLELAIGTQAGLCLDIEGDPFELLLFEDDHAADDHLLYRSHALRAGRLILASAPKRFTDPLNSRPLRANALQWSKHLGDERLAQALVRASAPLTKPNDSSPISLQGLVTDLREKGLGVLVRRACYRDSLPVGARTGVHVEIDGDPFILYRFGSPDLAARHDPDPSHSLRFDRFVLRSDPANTYREAQRATGRNNDTDVGWSSLLANDSFVSCVRSLVPVQR